MSNARGFTFRTQDMAMVTYLLIRGYQHHHLERIEGGCHWVYEERDPSMQRSVEEYRQDEAWVEPREFTRKLALVRREMYTFLGQTPKRIQTQTA
jgi:hypothetical protein